MRWAIQAAERRIVTFLKPARRWVVHRQLLSAHAKATRHLEWSCRTPVTESYGETVLKIRERIFRRSKQFKNRRLAWLLSGKLGAKVKFVLTPGGADYGRVSMYAFGSQSVERDN